MTTLDKANVAWVHKTADILRESGKHPLLGPFRHISDMEISKIVHKHTLGLIEGTGTGANVLNEVRKKDWELVVEDMEQFAEADRRRQEQEEKEEQERAKREACYCERRDCPARLAQAGKVTDL